VNIACEHKKHCITMLFVLTGDVDERLYTPPVNMGRAHGPCSRVKKDVRVPQSVFHGYQALVTHSSLQHNCTITSNIGNVSP